MGGKRWHPRHGPIAGLMLLTLACGALFSKLYASELLSHLITQPVDYIRTLDDYLQLRNQYNLIFRSLSYSLSRLLNSAGIPKNFHSALAEIAEKYDQLIGTDEVIKLAASRKVIL